MEMKKYNSWATHLPLLAAILARTRGPVIELGPGLYSTPTLTEVCRAMGRHYIGLDMDKDWIEHCRAHIGDRVSPNGYQAHQELHVVKDWKPETLDKFLKLSGCSGVPVADTAVCFVDQAPEYSRAKTAEWMLDNVYMVVCHDTDPKSEKRLNIQPTLKRAKFRLTYDRLMPFTDVVSNFSSLDGYLKVQNP